MWALWTISSSHIVLSSTGLSSRTSACPSQQELSSSVSRDDPTFNARFPSRGYSGRSFASNCGDISLTDWLINMTGISTARFLWILLLEPSVNTESVKRDHSPLTGVGWAGWSPLFLFHPIQTPFSMEISKSSRDYMSGRRRRERGCRFIVYVRDHRQRKHERIACRTWTKNCSSCPSTWWSRTPFFS